jgi:hypothetical protein
MHAVAAAHALQFLALLFDQAIHTFSELTTQL